MNKISNTKSVEVKANGIAQAPPAQDNQKAEKMTAGGCPAAPCSACGEELSEHVFRFAEIDMSSSEKEKIRQEFRQSNPPPNHLLILDNDDVPPEMKGLVEFVPLGERSSRAFLSHQ